MLHNTLWRKQLRVAEYAVYSAYGSKHFLAALYPFASHFCALGDVRLHYVDEGEGRPVLMVHGNPTWSFYWRRLIERFRGTHRVVAVDHIGCGLSDKPQQYAYTLQRHIDNLVAVIDQLDLRDATLVAHDWGGAIGLGRRGRRDRSGFARLCCSTPAPFRRRSFRGGSGCVGFRGWAVGASGD